MRLIDADALYDDLYENMGEDEVLDRIPPCYVDDAPTVDAVPVSELLNLRDELYEKDQITMRGLEKLNRLIAAYSSQLKQQEHPIESTPLNQEERWLKTV